LPLKEIVRTLSQAGYQGDYEVELMGEEIETSDYRDLLSHSLSAFAALQPAVAKEAPLPPARRASESL
jgi:hypothetical protein